MSSLKCAPSTKINIIVTYLCTTEMFKSSEKHDVFAVGVIVCFQCEREMIYLKFSDP